MHLHSLSPSVVVGERVRSGLSCRGGIVHLSPAAVACAVRAGGPGSSDTINAPAAPGRCVHFPCGSLRCETSPANANACFMGCLRNRPHQRVGGCNSTHGERGPAGAEQQAGGHSLRCCQENRAGLMEMFNQGRFVDSNCFMYSFIHR